MLQGLETHNEVQSGMPDEEEPGMPDLTEQSRCLQTCTTSSVRRGMVVVWMPVPLGFPQLQEGFCVDDARVQALCAWMCCAGICGGGGCGL